MVASVKNGLLILHVNVIHSTLVGENNACARMVWSQQHLGVIHNLHCPFTKYASCTFVGITWKFVQMPSCSSHDMYQPYSKQKIPLTIATHGTGLLAVDSILFFVASAYLQVDDDSSQNEGYMKTQLNGTM